MKRTTLRLFVRIPHIKLFPFDSYKVKQFTMPLLRKFKSKLESNSSHNKKVDYNRKPTKIEQLSFKFEKLSFKLKRLFDVIKHKIKRKPIDPDSSGRTESITAEEASLDDKSPVSIEEGKKRLGGTDAEKKNKKSKSKSTSQSHKYQAEDGIKKKRKKVSRSNAIDVEKGQHEQDKFFFDPISCTELDEFSISCETIETSDIYLSSEEEKKRLKQTNENDAKKKKPKRKRLKKNDSSKANEGEDKPTKAEVASKKVVPIADFITINSGVLYTIEEKRKKSKTEKSKRKSNKVSKKHDSKLNVTEISCAIGKREPRHTFSLSDETTLSAGNMTIDTHLCQNNSVEREIAGISFDQENSDNISAVTEALSKDFVSHKMSYKPSNVVSFEKRLKQRDFLLDAGVPCVKGMKK